MLIITHMPPLTWVWIVSKEWAGLCENVQAPGVCNMSSKDGKVVGIPWLHHLWEHSAKDLDKWDKGDSILDHQERIASHHAFAAPEDFTLRLGLWTTSIASQQKQLKPKWLPLGQSWWTVQSIAMQLSSLKPFLALTSMKPYPDCMAGGSWGSDKKRLLSSAVSLVSCMGLSGGVLGVAGSMMVLDR